MAATPYKPFTLLSPTVTTSGTGTLSQALPFQCRVRLCLELFSRNQPTAQRSLSLLPATARRAAPYPGTVGAWTTDQHAGGVGVGVLVGVGARVGVGVRFLDTGASEEACAGDAICPARRTSSAPLHTSKANSISLFTAHDNLACKEGSP